MITTGKKIKSANKAMIKHTDEQNMNPTKFRDHFSKPRRYATRKEEIMRLRVAMRNKELDCIEQYLSRCKNDNIKKFIELEVVTN
jgi:hypothetical protein